MRTTSIHPGLFSGSTQGAQPNLRMIPQQWLRLWNLLGPPDLWAGAMISTQLHHLCFGGNLPLEVAKWQKPENPKFCFAQDLQEHLKFHWFWSTRGIITHEVTKNPWGKAQRSAMGKTLKIMKDLVNIIGDEYTLPEYSLFISHFCFF